MKFLLLEFQKSKHNKLYIIPIISAALVYLWISWSISRDNLKNADDIFLMILYEIPIINSLIFPIVIATLSSRIWDEEFKGNTLKMLYTIEKPLTLYSSKTLFGMMYLFFTALFELISVIILFIKNNAYTMFFSKHIFFMFISTLAVSIAIFLIMQLINFLYENQVIVMTCGLFLSFAGLFSLFFGKIIQFFVPSAYYSLLQTAYMDYNFETRDMSFHLSDFNISIFIFVIIVSFAIYFISKKLFIRKDV